MPAHAGSTSDGSLGKSDIKLAPLDELLTQDNRFLTALDGCYLCCTAPLLYSLIYSYVSRQEEMEKKATKQILAVES
jgi:hypothetical protein